MEAGFFDFKGLLLPKAYKIDFDLDVIDDEVGKYGVAPIDSVYLAVPQS